MVQGCEGAVARAMVCRAPRVSYRNVDAAQALAEPGMLAVIGFGAGREETDDPRWLRLPLEPFDAPAPLECWEVAGPVSCGRTGDIRWSRGDGWLFASVSLDESACGSIETCAAEAYRQLAQFLVGQAESQVLRVWNYLPDINQGDGDGERYKRFCSGRAGGMGAAFVDGFPAATAIGSPGCNGRLQVYLLASSQPGARVENPRQVSAWRYPRQYGPTPPSFARAVRLPAGDALAISGTAAVIGHASAHHGDLPAQLAETLANLEALLAAAGMPPGFDTHSPLKAYIRRPGDARTVRDFFRRHLSGVPALLLHGEVCRRELLVEVDGWRYA
ncbi:pteridine-dependent deoxygenase [Dyella lutea]|uniref:Pteridine-dependent deoxygenase n=1 Tax=Dyella lutea TaxID=2950441 RepID=A0ABT1F5G3_9GAMM|nr:pteridine-dependent deoxygenase [Dyella lutea]MCP1372580.1 pteridine-dependent deoxygenase [Dyella lutea]